MYMKKIGIVYTLVASVFSVVLLNASPVFAGVCECAFTVTEGPSMKLGSPGAFNIMCAASLSSFCTCSDGSADCKQSFTATVAECDDASGTMDVKTKYLSGLPVGPNVSSPSCVYKSKPDPVEDPDKGLPKGPGSGPAPALKSVVLTDPMGGKGIVGAIASLVSIFLGMVGAIALLVFVYAGVVYMTAGGSDERVKHAKDTMQYALIGLALITFAYALANFYFVALTS